MAKRYISINPQSLQASKNTVLKLQQHLQDNLNFLAFSWQKYGQYLGYVLFMVVLLTVFESCQQYFYIVRYDLAPNEQNLFATVVVAQFYRWLIWLAISLMFFLRYIKKTEQAKPDETPVKTWLFINIAALVIINIGAIACLEIVIGAAPFSFSVFNETLVFRFFQKTPIYTLAYIALFAIYSLLNLKDNLQVEIVGLKDLSDKQKMAIDDTDINENKTSQQEQDLTMLSIKVGNSYKMIDIDDICWLEAYDYCVKIHTLDAQVFAMRNSLKALEKQLTGKHFLRIHRKAIVNMQKAREISFTPNPRVILENELALEIAQSRVKDVKAYLQ